MKQFLLSLFFICAFSFVRAQEKTVTQLPPGKYETSIKNGSGKWERGDIILIDDSHYRISTSNDTGEYKFSSVAQRVFFTSGPLKNMFAKTSLNNNTPAIILPVAENAQAGVRAEVWCYLRQ